MTIELGRNIFNFILRKFSFVIANENGIHFGFFLCLTYTVDGDLQPCPVMKEHNVSIAASVITMFRDVPPLEWLLRIVMIFALCDY